MTLTVSVLIFWGLVNAEWKNEKCIPDLKCIDASSNYTEPYCYMESINIDYAKKCMWSLVTNNLSNVNNKSKRDIIEWFCKSLLSEWQIGWRIYYAIPEIDGLSWDWRQTFDSHQSLFVYSLCASFKDKSGNSIFLWNWYDFKPILKWDIVERLKLQQNSKGKDLCSLKDSESLADCDLSIYATEIFSAIMSEVFKIKYAQVINVDNAENFADKEKRIIDFLSGYFNMTDSYKKLQSEFPQTISVIDSNQKYYKRVLDTLTFIDNDKLSGIAEKWCSISDKKVWIDFFACAMHASQWNGSTLDPAFLTWFYNELINYRVFVQYYQIWLERAIKESANENQKILSAHLTDITNYINMQLSAASETLHNLEEMAMSYPLHIGVLLYQEKIKNFRDRSLSPIVTHFYSLSEKLQNVQIKSSS